MLPLRPVTQALMLICSAVFCAQLLLPVGLMARFLALWPLASGLFLPWQVISYAFLHGAFTHLFFNMLGLYMIRQRARTPVFSRRQFLKSLLALGAWHFASPSSGSAAPLPIEGEFDFTKSLIQAPDEPDLWPLFRQKLAQWREQTRRSSHYSDVRYREREMAWASSSFSSCFLMLWDSVFYDRQAGQFKVDEFLSMEERDFGGFDNLILWHAYPRI